MRRTQQGEVLFLEVTGATGMGKGALLEISRQGKSELLMPRQADPFDLRDTDAIWLELLRQLLHEALSLGTVPETKSWVG